MHVARLEIGMAEYNTTRKQRDLKIDVYLHGIRDGTHRWKGNTCLDILVSWILGVGIYSIAFKEHVCLFP